MKVENFSTEFGNFSVNFKKEHVNEIKKKSAKIVYESARNIWFQDVTVEPNESSHFEFYVPGQDKEILPLRESQLYLEDWIGKWFSFREKIFSSFISFLLKKYR